MAFALGRAGLACPTAVRSRTRCCCLLGKSKSFTHNPKIHLSHLRPPRLSQAGPKEYWTCQAKRAWLGGSSSIRSAPLFGLGNASRPSVGGILALSSGTPLNIRSPTGGLIKCGGTFGRRSISSGFAPLPDRRNGSHPDIAIDALSSDSRSAMLRLTPSTSRLFVSPTFQKIFQKSISFLTKDKLGESRTNARRSACMLRLCAQTPLSRSDTRSAHPIHHPPSLSPSTHDWFLSADTYCTSQSRSLTNHTIARCMRLGFDSATVAVCWPVPAILRAQSWHGSTGPSPTRYVRCIWSQQRLASSM